MVSVLTVDDQAVFRRVAREVIDATPGFEPAGEACGGEQALEMIEQLDPALVLLDVRMPGMDGIETARRVAATRPDTVVVLISIDDPDSVSPASRTCGAVELVDKKRFGPNVLRRLWAEHGAGAQHAAPAITHFG